MSNWWWPYLDVDQRRGRTARKYSLRNIVPPAIEPITLGELKDHLKIDPDISEDDPLIELIIVGARQLAETQSSRSLITQTWDVNVDGLHSYLAGVYSSIEIPLSPVQSITSINYYDTGNALQTLDPTQYETDLAAVRPIVRPAWNVSWPQTYQRQDAVTVRVVVGFGDAAANVPAAIRLWMKAAAATMYTLRATADVDTRLIYAANPFIDGLLDPYRIVEI